MLFLCLRRIWCTSSWIFKIRVHLWVYKGIKENQLKLRDPAETVRTRKFEKLPVGDFSAGSRRAGRILTNQTRRTWSQSSSNAACVPETFIRRTIWVINSWWRRWSQHQVVITRKTTTTTHEARRRWDEVDLSQREREAALCVGRTTS